MNCCCASNQYWNSNISKWWNDQMCELWIQFFTRVKSKTLMSSLSLRLTLLSSFPTCLSSTNKCTFVFVHACVLHSSELVLLFFRDVRVRGGMHLPYRFSWPPVTETIWSVCQNLIREWNRRGGFCVCEGGGGGGIETKKQRRGKSSAIWEQDGERGKWSDRGEGGQMKKLVGKVEGKQWNLSQLLWRQGISAES